MQNFYFIGLRVISRLSKQIVNKSPILTLEGEYHLVIGNIWEDIS